MNTFFRAVVPAVAPEVKVGNAEDFGKFYSAHVMDLNDNLLRIPLRQTSNMSQLSENKLFFQVNRSVSNYTNQP